MNTGEEEVPISAIRKGDIVLHPQRLEWMRVVDVKEGVATDIHYAQDQMPRVVKESWRSLFLDRLDRLPIETPMPVELYYRDIEQLITRVAARWATVAAC